jgi:hypothetical protein
VTGLRIFAILAAMFLVAAVALGSILPADEPMSQVLADISSGSLLDLQSFEIAHFGAWAWRDITVPLLVRPVWMLPLGFGVICLGVMTSLNWVRTPSRPRHRRRS